MVLVDKAVRGYHDLLRREILELIPSDAKKILDLGCGTGVLGKALKQRQPCQVDGIELCKEAAEEARKNLDAVFVDNLNRFDPSFLKQKYDCIILGDILEHLINPWTVLTKFSAVLEDNGLVIASIPNISHPSVVDELKEGLFRYKFSGLLDITHLRFFTKTSIFQLFYRASLKIINISPHPSDKNPIQYLVRAVKPRALKERPLTTILILSCNGWNHTQMCINSIKQKTHSPYRILVIDNGSTDETIPQLRKDRSLFHIENATNLGFAKGFNVGLTLVDTPYFVLANSDTIVTDHWLAGMIENIQAEKELVILGPRTNYASGPQVIENVPYKDAEGLAKFAVSRLPAVKEAITYFFRISFFFTLFKTAVLMKVGFLDEQFGLGNFEDDDYCMRVHQKGLKTAYDNTVFIHHWGNRTFVNNKISHADLMRKNKALFLKKWNLKEYGKSQPFKQPNLSEKA